MLQEQVKQNNMMSYNALNISKEIRDSLMGAIICPTSEKPLKVSTEPSLMLDIGNLTNNNLEELIGVLHQIREHLFGLSVGKSVAQTGASATSSYKEYNPFLSR